MSDTEPVFAEVDDAVRCECCDCTPEEPKICTRCKGPTCGDCWHERDEMCRGCCEYAGIPFPYRGDKWEQREQW